MTVQVSLHRRISCDVDGWCCAEAIVRVQEPEASPLCAVRPDVASTKDGFEDFFRRRVFLDELVADGARHDEGGVVAGEHSTVNRITRNGVFEARGG